jgi:hypothetical protein
MANKWQIGPVKLANGEEAFIDAINEGQEECHYTGRIKSRHGYWVAAAWHLNGRYAGDMFLESNDLLNLAPPPRKTVLVRRWLVIHQNGMSSTYFDRQKAITVEKDIFALIPIDREVTEGEGL